MNRVSIILPIYNSAIFLAASIQSVLNQSHEDWELLLINDGSKDDSKEIALSFMDPRIQYYEQENKGVASARNHGLAKMKGDFFCFLDADDVLPHNSLLSRLSLFRKNNEIQFADGTVFKMDANLMNTQKIWRPKFRDNPLSDLVKLGGKSFFGPTWMIKRDSRKNYAFQEGLSHGEDLFFFMELAMEGGKYEFTDDVILYYRDTPGSAMKNLSGLEKGYRFIENTIIDFPKISKMDFWIYRIKYRKFMSIAYLRNRQFKNAILCWG